MLFFLGALLVFLPGLLDVGVGHAGDVVGYCAGYAFFGDAGEMVGRKLFRVFGPGVEEGFHDVVGVGVFGFQFGRLIEIGV